MKVLDWIILTSWSVPPRTPRLQQAGLHCSLLSLYMCACKTMVSPSHLQVDTASPTWMLIIFLIGFLDSVTSPRDGKTPRLCSSISAAALFFWLRPQCVSLVTVVVLVSTHFHTAEWRRPAATVNFDSWPSSCRPLSSLSVFTSSHSYYSSIQPFGPANTFETSTSQTPVTRSANTKTMCCINHLCLMICRW